MLTTTRICSSVFRTFLASNTRQSLGIVQSSRTLHRTSINLSENQSSTVDIINQKGNSQLMVESYNDQGFRLTNGAFAIGPIVLFPNVILRWNINSVEEIHAESLALFRLLEPKLDLVIIGIGDSSASTIESMTRLRRAISDCGIKAEFMPTRHAVATYNFMLDDYRVVGGAFLPLQSPVNHKLLEMQRESTKNKEGPEQPNAS